MAALSSAVGGEIEKTERVRKREESRRRSKHLLCTHPRSFFEDKSEAD
jgi:hypothetical protein